MTAVCGVVSTCCKSKHDTLIVLSVWPLTFSSSFSCLDSRLLFICSIIWLCISLFATLSAFSYLWQKSHWSFFGTWKPKLNSLWNISHAVKPFLDRCFANVVAVIDIQIIHFAKSQTWRQVFPVAILSTIVRGNSRKLSNVTCNIIPNANSHTSRIRAFSCLSKSGCKLAHRWQRHPICDCQGCLDYLCMKNVLQTRIILPSTISSCFSVCFFMCLLDFFVIPTEVFLTCLAIDLYSRWLAKLPNCQNSWNKVSLCSRLILAWHCLWHLRPQPGFMILNVRDW